MVKHNSTYKALIIFENVGNVLSLIADVKVAITKKPLSFARMSLVIFQHLLHRLTALYQLLYNIVCMQKLDLNLFIVKPEVLKNRG